VCTIGLWCPLVTSSQAIEHIYFLVDECMTHKQECDWKVEKHISRFLDIIFSICAKLSVGCIVKASLMSFSLWDHGKRWYCF
jgi:hypothetical protein